MQFASASAVLLCCVIASISGCDLQLFFGKQVSVEQSATSAQIVFRGLKTGVAQTAAANDLRSVFTAYFDLINTYKGADLLVVNNYRKINVTFEDRDSFECESSEDVPLKYIVFCDVVNEELRAVSVAQWSEETDQRVWSALGWSRWTDWSPCSVSCSGGIQQRVRNCHRNSCPGYNIEQRHCNLFGCLDTINPLAVEDDGVFHPTKSRWQKVPDRPSAWRLQPSTYIWLPASQVFTKSVNHSIPKEFTIFVTLRLTNESRMGTIFSLRSRRRQDAYLSLELAGSDLKLVHAAANGTDVVRVPAGLDDRRWHQIAISIRDDSVVQSYVDCEWSGMDILRKGSLDIPQDSDLIIGYLFSGDLEQISIVPDSTMVGLQCSGQRTPIIDATKMQENSKKLFSLAYEMKKKHRSKSSAASPSSSYSPSSSLSSSSEYDTL